jgi:hypothetical protein
MAAAHEAAAKCLEGGKGHDRVHEKNCRRRAKTWPSENTAA